MKLRKDYVLRVHYTVEHFNHISNSWENNDRIMVWRCDLCKPEVNEILFALNRAYKIVSVKGYLGFWGRKLDDMVVFDYTNIYNH